MKKVFLMFGWCSILALASSCQSRATTSMWENTKTATRYFGRGLKVLGGKGADSRLIHYPYEFEGPQDLDYIQTNDEEDSDSQLVASYPLAQETPGEMGSFLPGLEGFHHPSEKEQQVFRLLHFDTNKDHVKGTDDYQTIKDVAKYLKKNPSTYVYILGHCDARGTDIYNMALGSRRSNTVRNLLIEQGVNLNRLFTVSYGKEKPLNHANTPKAWEENRRVEFRIYKKK